jgi:hypothetical protein
MGARIVPEPNTPREIVESAVAALDEARALAQDLEQRARAGDSKVTQQQVEDAHRGVTWAEYQVDAAQVRAAAREEELRRQAYRNVLDANLATATIDVSAEVESHLAEARPHIEAALNLLGDRNRALVAVATFVDNDANFKDPEDFIEGKSEPLLPGGSWFEYQGQRYEYLPASIVVRDLLGPFKLRIRSLSGGRDGEFVKGI